MKPLPVRQMLTGVFIVSLLPFLAVEIFPSSLYHVLDITKYLVFHNIAEFFSVMVSFSIFGVGWFTYEQSRDRHVLFLSAAFLAIGLMDFMHTLGYAGMPPFITPNSANKSTQYWIAVRFFAASAFLASAFIYPERPCRWLSKRTLMVAAIAVPALIFIGITFFPEDVPATFIQGVGLTPFKKISEYLIISLLILASAAYWQRMSRTGERLLVYFQAAFILCIFSELVFAVYKSVFDTYNVLGHIYKVVAFYLIYKGIFTTAVNNPYVKLSDANERLLLEVSERKLAEERVIGAKEEWERTFDAITDPIMVLDADHRIVKVNRGMAEKLGTSAAAAVGLKCYRAVHDCDEPPSFCPHARLLADGQPHSAEIHEERLGGDFLVAVSPLHTPEGKLSGSVHYAREISEIKHAQRAVQSERQRLFDVLEILPVYVVLLTTDYHVPFANRFFSERFGESHGRRCFEYLFGRTGPCEICETYTVLKSNAPHHWEWTGPDGRNYDIFDFPFTDTDGSALILEMGIDITERKRAEEALMESKETLERRVIERTEELAAANKELEAFAYSVSHDLRAPLRAIYGFSTIIMEDYATRLDDEGKRVLTVITKNAQRMGQLIDDILAFSRIGRQEMRSTVMPMHDICREVFAELAKGEGERSIRFTLGPLPPAQGDPPLIRQVLQNLLENSVKYTRTREIAEIEVGCRCEADENIFFVRDNGVGFDMKYAGKLFGVFQRLHGMDEFEGTGVGLAIVQRIIERHGGRIWGEGRIDEGATFYFTLPTGNASAGDGASNGGKPEAD